MSKWCEWKDLEHDFHNNCDVIWFFFGLCTFCALVCTEVFLRLDDSHTPFQDVYSIYRMANCAKGIFMFSLCSIQIRKNYIHFLQLVCVCVRYQNELLKHLLAPSETMESYENVGEYTITLEIPLSRCCFIMINNT